VTAKFRATMTRWLEILEGGETRSPPSESAS
jgi:hypothetical protein